MITEDKLSADSLYENISKMVKDSDKLSEMSQNLRKIAKTDALERIYNLMQKMAQKKNA